MAVFKQVKLSFEGSFQCRLATDADPADSSRSDPFGDISQPKSLGWTFAYNEQRLDRLIRFKDPVQLRSGLVDPFVPVKVTRIEVQPEPLFGVELPWQVIPADPLLGLPVSLGDQAIFDTAAGGGTGFEAILNCKMTIGDVLQVAPNGVPKLKGVELVPGASTEYLMKKPLALAPQLPLMDATRRKVLTQPNLVPPFIPLYVETYARPFGMRDELVPISATVDFSPAGATGILASILLGWSWTLNMTFSRFDGDTLTGRVEGNLWGVHSFL